MSQAPDFRDPTPARPDLHVAPSPEELADRYYLAAQFEDSLKDNPDYRSSTSPSSRASITPLLAFSFIEGKVKTMPEHLRRKPVINRGTFHSALERFNKEFTPGVPLTQVRQQEKEQYLDRYTGIALNYTHLPEVQGMLVLLDHAEGLGHESTTEAVRTLVALYGRSIEVIYQAAGYQAIGSNSFTE